MATVKVSYDGGTDLSQVKINDALVLLGNGEASVGLEGGPEHALTWFVRGAPGSSYTLKITAPDEAKFTHEATMDSSTMDAGLHWFTVKGGK